MSRLGTTLVAATFAVGMLITSLPARGAVAYDADYAGESVFVTVAQGDLAMFTVAFANTGAETWIRDTPSEVVLGACREDQVSCGVPPETYAWSAGWVSGFVYARQVPDVVPPGKVAFFTYSVRAPLAAPRGTYAFHGELLRASTLGTIHAVGYYQQATIILPPAPQAVFPRPAYSAPGSLAPQGPAPTTAPTPPPPPPPVPPPPPPPPPPAGH